MSHHAFGRVPGAGRAPSCRSSASVRCPSAGTGRPAEGAREGTGDATIVDTLWLGYWLTGNRQEGRRFRGEIDELFVVDRALQSREIAALMKPNRLPEETVAKNP